MIKPAILSSTPQIRSVPSDGYIFYHYSEKKKCMSREKRLVIQKISCMTRRFFLKSLFTYTDSGSLCFRHPAAFCFPPAAASYSGRCSGCYGCSDCSAQESPPLHKDRMGEGKGKYTKYGKKLYQFFTENVII